jgi:hypothetical protein
MYFMFRYFLTMPLVSLVVENIGKDQFLFQTKICGVFSESYYKNAYIQIDYTF